MPERQPNNTSVMLLAEEFGIVCMKRSDDDPEKMLKEDPFLQTIASHVTVIETPADTRQVSSTRIRRRLAELEAEFREVQNDTPKELHAILLGVIGGKGIKE